jgi:hypothetical protein
MGRMMDCVSLVQASPRSLQYVHAEPNCGV